LILRDEPILGGLRKLILESGAAYLTYQKDPDPFGRALEPKIDELCRSLGVVVESYHDVSLHAPADVLTGGGQPYRVFTPYSKQWLSREKRGGVNKVEHFSTPNHLASLPSPTLEHWGLANPAPQRVQGGEKAARQRMKEAVQNIVSRYNEKKDLPSADGTSRLSQDLRWGLISIRELHAKVLEVENSLPIQQREGCLTYRKELAWRDFYFAILHHFPEVLHHEFSITWRDFAWQGTDEHWNAWCLGQTGFPIVDAGMRELLATGFMHNRVRMIVAMFLTKDLHIDWRRGESWFMRHLIDGDIASNNGGWQWSAGTGADAAPYFRIQNPWSQTTRFDPQGIYIKRWIPELANVSPEKFLTPPSMGRSIAAGYPLPIVDHGKERERTLAMFTSHKAAKS
jgi:deoxyribodipyrimidine photo-lyase